MNDQLHEPNNVEGTGSETMLQELLEEDLSKVYGGEDGCDGGGGGGGCDGAGAY